MERKDEGEKKTPPKPPARGKKRYPPQNTPPEESPPPRKSMTTMTSLRGRNRHAKRPGARIMAFGLEQSLVISIPDIFQKLVLRFAEFWASEVFKFSERLTWLSSCQRSVFPGRSFRKTNFNFLFLGMWHSLFSARCLGSGCGYSEEYFSMKFFVESEIFSRIWSVEVRGRRSGCCWRPWVILIRRSQSFVVLN